MLEKKFKKLKLLIEQIQFHRLMPWRFALQDDKLTIEYDEQDYVIDFAQQVVIHHTWDVSCHNGDIRNYRAAPVIDHTTLIHVLDREINSAEYLIIQKLPEKLERDRKAALASNFLNNLYEDL